MEEKKIFAKGYCFAKIFMIFTIGCIIGTYYEQFLTLFKDGVWESRQGVIYGPFNPIYGFGFAIFVILLGKNNDKRKWYITYLYSCIIGGVTEYTLSLMGEKLFQVNAWDYSFQFLNIGGRTTIPFMLFWGLGGLIFMKFIYPALSKLIEKIPYNFAKFAFPIFVTFMSLNIVVSYTAVLRQNFRKQGKPPVTFIGKLYDDIYTDEFLEKVFPNMEHKEIKSN